MPIAADGIRAEGIRVKVTIDPDKLLFGDLEILEKASAGGGMTEFIALIERVATVEGVDDVRKVPLSQFKEIIGALNAAMGKSLDTKN